MKASKSIMVIALGLTFAAPEALAQAKPRPRVETDRPGRGAVPEKSARWEHPQPARRKSEPVRLEAAPRKTERSDRGRVADRVYPDVKWQGGEHTRRFGDTSNPKPSPDPGGAGSGGGNNGGNGGKSGAAAPPSAPAPKPPAPRP